ncbi:MAG: hypothetical protein WB765_14360, partial [Acidimicrobiales bacterium]
MRTPTEARRWLLIGMAVAGLAVLPGRFGSSLPTATAASPTRLRVTWMHGFDAPGTPARYDKVGILKVGPSTAKNVLVLEPGTSAGSAY